MKNDEQNREKKRRRPKKKKKEKEKSKKRNAFKMKNREVDELSHYYFLLYLSNDGIFRGGNGNGNAVAVAAASVFVGHQSICLFFFLFSSHW